MTQKPECFQLLPNTEVTIVADAALRRVSASGEIAFAEKLGLASELSRKSRLSANIIGARIDEGACPPFLNEC